MQKMEFVRVLLVEKGVKPQLTNPYFYLWWKLLRIEAKPRVFESPFKLFFLQAIFGSVFGVDLCGCYFGSLKVSQHSKCIALCSSVYLPGYALLLRWLEHDGSLGSAH